MLRLGSAVLTAVLLGVPRALDARAFGAPRSVYVEVADPAPGLAGFADELTRVLEGGGWQVAPRKRGATIVVEVHAHWKGVGPTAGPFEAISFTVQDARGRRPLVVHYSPGDRATAARALVDCSTDVWR